MATAQKKRAGRPSKFTQEIADIICERMSSGLSLNAICKEPGIPNAATVFRWLEKDKAFRENYTRACETRTDLIFDQILDIADTPKMGVKTINKATGVETVEADMVEHRRLQIDARKWVLGKMSPKKYGERPAGSEDPHTLKIVITNDPENANSTLDVSEVTSSPEDDL